MDWELHEGLALRVEEAVAAAERDRLVRELRAARRARRTGRARWWPRNRLLRKEIAVGR